MTTPENGQRDSASLRSILGTWFAIIVGIVVLTVVGAALKGRIESAADVRDYAEAGALIGLVLIPGTIAAYGVVVWIASLGWPERILLLLWFWIGWWIFLSADGSAGSDEERTQWLRWAAALAFWSLTFMLVSWIPLHRLDRLHRLVNPIGRPILLTAILSGGAAFLALTADLRLGWLLVVGSFLGSQYAVLSGRFLSKEFKQAGWALVLTTGVIWWWYFTA